MSPAALRASRRRRAQAAPHVILAALHEPRPRRTLRPGACRGLWPLRTLNAAAGAAIRQRRWRMTDSVVAIAVRGKTLPTRPDAAPFLIHSSHCRGGAPVKRDAARALSTWAFRLGSSQCRIALAITYGNGNRGRPVISRQLVVFDRGSPAPPRRGRCPSRRPGRRRPRSGRRTDAMTARGCRAALWPPEQPDGSRGSKQ